MALIATHSLLNHRPPPFLPCLSADIEPHLFLLYLGISFSPIVSSKPHLLHPCLAMSLKLLLQLCSSFSSYLLRLPSLLSSSLSLSSLLSFSLSLYYRHTYLLR